MNTREVAAYLRVKERKIYDLVAQRSIPCTRAAGKWLFPKELIDAWLLASAEGVPEALPRRQPAAIFGGSHDPLLDWAIRESGCGLAVLFNGSLDGLERFAERQVLGCGLHVLDAASGDYNTPLLQRRLGAEAAVALQWARRRQGLMLAAEKRREIKTVKDLIGKRLAGRQKEAGSYILLHSLLEQAGLSGTDVEMLDPPARSETEVAEAIADGRADAGLGIAAAARRLGLAFVPLAWERYDLLLWRRYYFEPPLQTLLAFCRGDAFAAYARELSGYDLDGFLSVRFNGS